MFFFECTDCGLLVQVTGDPEENRQLLVDHPHWLRGRPCIRFGCAGQVVQIEPNALDKKKSFIQIGGKDFFRALCGGGMPEEIVSHPEVIRAFLLSAQIIKVDIRSVAGDVRCCIDRIYLANGTVLHLGASSAGAMVFKVTKNVQTSSALEVRPHSHDGEVQRECGGSSNTERLTEGDTQH